MGVSTWANSDARDIRVGPLDVRGGPPEGVLAIVAVQPGALLRVVAVDVEFDAVVVPGFRGVIAELIVVDVDQGVEVGHIVQDPELDDELRALVLMIGVMIGCADAVFQMSSTLPSMTGGVLT